jgi:hypothetical protein
LRTNRRFSFSKEQEDRVAIAVRIDGTGFDQGLDDGGRQAPVDGEIVENTGEVAGMFCRKPQGWFPMPFQVPGGKRSREEVAEPLDSSLEAKVLEMHGQIDGPPPPPTPWFQFMNFAPVTDRTPVGVCYVALSQRSCCAPVASRTASSGRVRT